MEELDAADVDAGVDGTVHANADAADGAAALDGTALRIDFRLGTLALTLGELRTLAPGTVLELADGGAGAIAIACGGRVLGQGEAVDVAGRLGIRITRWDASC
jgi:type III secretion protein Q